jgi:hypothetical protein
VLLAPILMLSSVMAVQSPQGPKVIAKVPSTGVESAQTLIVDANQEIWLIHDESGFRLDIGKQVPVSDARLARRIPKHRAVTFFKGAKVANLDLRIVVTTGLRRDPETEDEFGPYYVRADDIDIYCRSCPGYPRLLHRSFEEIDDVSLEDLARNGRPFVVVDFREGMHTYSVDLFRLLSNGRFQKVAIPDLDIDGQSTDRVEEGKDGLPVLSSDIRHVGNFDDAPPGTKSRTVHVEYRWNRKRARFEVAEKKTTYSKD